MRSTPRRSTAGDEPTRHIAGLPDRDRSEFVESPFSWMRQPSFVLPTQPPMGENFEEL